MRLLITNIICLVLTVTASAQTASMRCSEQMRKNDEEGLDSVIITTCLYKNFKFVSTASPDYAGRYVFYQREVYVKANGSYVQTTNDRFFNKSQTQLVEIINRRIRKEFDDLVADTSLTGKCLAGVDPPPTYKMNDFEISFRGDDIWFEVRWGLSGACRAFDGSIVTFKFKEIEKYLR